MQNVTLYPWNFYQSKTSKNIFAFSSNMASRSTDYPRFWFLTVDPDVHDIDEDEATLWVEEILQDERGWKRFGYQFINIDTDEGLYLRSLPGMKKYVFHLRMSTPTTIKSECKFDGLSCADMGQNVIFFNRDRWLYGSKESGLPLDEYRYQLCSHEIGHLLGRGHHKCSKNHHDKCPVMYQQTISKGCCSPNPWPLEWE